MGFKGRLVVYLLVGLLLPAISGMMYGFNWEVYGWIGLVTLLMGGYEINCRINRIY